MSESDTMRNIEGMLEKHGNGKDPLQRVGLSRARVQSLLAGGGETPSPKHVKTKNGNNMSKNKSKDLEWVEIPRMQMPDRGLQGAAALLRRSVKKPNRAMLYVSGATARECGITAQCPRARIMFARDGTECRIEADWDGHLARTAPVTTDANRVAFDIPVPDWFGSVSEVRYELENLILLPAKVVREMK